MVDPMSVVTAIELLLKAVGKVRKTLTLFKIESRRLKMLLKILLPRINEVKNFDEETAGRSREDENLANVRREEMDELLEELKQCKQLIRECEKVPMWNICLVRDCAQRLKGHNEYLRDFVHISMAADAWTVARKGGTVNSILLGSAVPQPPKHMVGWKARVEELKQKMSQEDIQVLGIWGLGGSGKTTLAAKFCEQAKGEFCKISFLTISKRPNLLVMVSRLWRDLINDVNQDFLDVDDAMDHLNSRLEQKMLEGKVLVVLDDVGPDPNVEKLVIRKPGFKTLVTSKMNLNWTEHNYKVQPLEMEEARELFFHHARVPEQDSRRELHRELVEQIVEGCMRLPLPIKVIGALNKDPKEWQLRNTATKITESTKFLKDNDRVLKCLESSLELLSEKQRECFMDFSCFRGNKRIRAGAVMDMWIQFRGETELGARDILKQLFDYHLIELFERRRNEGGDPEEGFGDLFVSLHDLLAKLAAVTRIGTNNGRLVVNQTDELPNADRTSAAEIVSLDMGDGMRTFGSYTPPAFPCAEVLILNFSGSSCSSPPFLREMEKLKLLIITNCSRRAAELSELPPPSSLKNLRSVRLEKISLPILHTFTEPFQALQKLSMVLCEVSDEESSPVLDIPMILPEITVIEVDYCNGLERLPASVCEVPNLKKLSITNCHDLTELPEGIGRLSKLEVLRLRACTALESIPDSVSGLKLLKFLTLSDCSKISRLPDALGGLRRLQKINVRGCSATPPMSVRDLTSLQRVKCDPDTEKMWKPYLAYNNPQPKWDVHKAEVSLDFLQ